MRRKVRIVSLPKAGSGMEVNSTQSLNPGLGYSLSQSATMNRFAKPDTKVNRTLKAVPREEANLEAEKGETAFTDLNGDGIPEQYMIGGKRHYDGGTPLYLPDNSFIFSRDRTMKIKDPTILAQFGMSPAKSGYTPADIAKKYDINKFRKVLGDSDSDPLQRKSAEAMISNYNMKLGKLAIVQESTKGFPNGIPAISMPYIEQAGIDPASFVKAEPNQNQEQAVPQNQTEAQFEEPAPDQARYGTNVLSQLQKRKFGGSNKRKVRVILPQHQVGGVNLSTVKPSTSQTVTKPASFKKKFDTYADLYKEPNYQDLIDSGNAYIKDKDGKYKQVAYTPSQAPAEAYDDRLGKFKDVYANLYAEMGNQDAQDAIVLAYRKRVKALPDSNKFKTTLTNKSPEEIISEFMNLQKHNFALQGQGVKLMSEEWKNKNNPTLAYKTAIKKAGLEPLSDVEIASGQASYAGLIDVMNDDHYKETFKNFRTPTQIGDDDEKYDANLKLSPIDGVLGNTTGGNFVRVREAETIDKEYTDEVVTDTPKVKHLNKAAYTGNPDFWAQDIIKILGADSDMARIKKYRPWQATPNVMLPDPTFYDPTRELAAGQESANTLVRGLSAFTGPQALSSRTSAIQGQAATAAANTLGKYANLNVGVANQFELQKTSILNQASQNKAALATQLYDKNTIANQTFDNSKAAARQNLRQSYITALTNKANTYNLNSLYPQYAVDPLSGGNIDFTHGAGIEPDNTEDRDLGKAYEEVLRLHPTLIKQPKLALEIAKSMIGMPVTTSQNIQGYQDQNDAAGYPTDEQPSE